MISHRHKCIFVHIPRTAGTTIETWLSGKDWWAESPSSKHLTAHQARVAYNKYWDEYFKFSIVRNPLSRVVSLLNHRKHFGIKIEGRDIDFEGYYKLFGQEVIVEHDHRFHNRDSLQRGIHRSGAIYSNMLDEKLDYIGKFENLPEIFNTLSEKLSIAPPKNLIWQEKSPPMDLGVDTLSVSTRAEIFGMYEADFTRFGYDKK